MLSARSSPVSHLGRKLMMLMKAAQCLRAQHKHRNRISLAGRSLSLLSHTARVTVLTTRRCETHEAMQAALG